MSFEKLFLDFWEYKVIFNFCIIFCVQVDSREDETYLNYRNVSKQNQNSSRLDENQNCSNQKRKKKDTGGLGFTTQNK